MDISEKIEAFRSLLEADQAATRKRRYPSLTPETVTVKPGKKYVKVDVGTSGKYMVDVATGEIFGIKAYGVIHRGHQYGTLDTIAEFHWGEYRAIRKTAPATHI